MKGQGKLAINARATAHELTVYIADNGPGIPLEIQDRIFEPFFTTKQRGEGTGLGLDICKKIVQKHGGDMGFNTTSEGTTFWVKLPLAEQAQLADSAPQLHLATSLN